MQKAKPKRRMHPARRQRPPGLEIKMTELPKFDSETNGPVKKLEGKVALITGGDSGIGRAVAVAFARHGARIAICHLPEEAADAELTKQYTEALGSSCLLLPGDISRENACKRAVEKTADHFGQIDILVNNAGMHIPKDDIREITGEQLRKTFETNFFSMFYFVQSVLPHMKKGGSIINTTSVTAYRGSAHLLDYSATKGAIVSFTRSLSAALIDKKIRVNAVAPGPVWTPLIVSSMKPKEIATFGSDSPMGRAGEPAEIAPCFLFLACDDSSYMSGQVLHPNGGEVVNG
jgi:NAD(P)-dependent dehydrogenase (short-subunit alcohol dehydrogenase family)